MSARTAASSLALHPAAPLTGAPLRVAMATDSRDPSGVGRHMIDLALGLPPGTSPALGFSASPGGRSFAAQARGRGLEARAVVDWGDWLDRLRPDLLHVHAGIGWEGHGLVRLAAARGCPVVRTEHLPWLITDEAQRLDYAAMVGSVEALVAVSEGAGRTWRGALRHMPGPRRPLVVIANGVPPPAMLPQSLRPEVAPEHAPRLLCVARLTPQKAHRVLLGAFARLLREVPGARLTLVGGGPEEASLRRRAGRLGIAHAVEILGARDDVPILMAGATLLVLPSLFEGLPLVVLEAMALGLPVVATRIGGVEEALGAHHPWLAEPGSRRGLARALLAALRDPDRARAGARGQRRWAGAFTQAHMAGRTARLYEAVAGRPGQGKGRHDENAAWLRGGGGHRAPSLRHPHVHARRGDRGRL